jgi:hypothetical protein
MEQVRSFTAGNWQDLYTLTKGSETRYFLLASSTVLAAIEGREGIIAGDATHGLIGHWKFDEAMGGVVYDFAASSTGVFAGSPTRVASCRVSACVRFDGPLDSDYVDAGNSTLFTPPLVTIMGWVQFTNPTGNSEGIISAGDGSAAPVYELVKESDASLRFSVKTGGVATASTAGTFLIDAGWHHVAGTYDGTGIFLYVDGKEQASSTASGMPGTVTRMVLGGRWVLGSAGSFLTGLLDEARVYNRALTRDEVRRIATAVPLTRSFFVEDVNRDNDGNIAATGVLDPSTQKVTASTEWSLLSAAPAEMKMTQFLTRWRNAVFRQTDWSRGSGSEGPITQPTMQFATSTNVNTSLGSIRIEGL